MREWSFLIALFFLTGCGGTETAQVLAPPQQPQKKEAVTQGPSSLSTPSSGEGQTVEGPVYSYSPEGRRDPFKPVKPVKASGPFRNPLLTTELRDMKVIGILWGEYGYFAMVQVPEGPGYTVKVGTPVGPHDGVIKKITEKSVEVEEKHTDVFGEKKARRVILELHPEEEGS